MVHFNDKKIRNDATKAAGDASISELLQSAVASHRAGDVDTALVGYMRVAKQIEKSGAGSSAAASQVYSNIGALYMAKAQWELASRFFEKGAKAADAAVEAGNGGASVSAACSAHFNLAVVLTTKLDRHSEALEHCQRVLGLDGAHVKALHLTGNVLQSMGHQAGAERFFQRAQAAAEGGGDGSAASAVQADHAGVDEAGGGDDEAWASSALLDMAVGDSRTIAVPSGGRADAVSVAVRCLSRAPFVFHVAGLLSEGHCRHIIDRATADPAALKPSYVTGAGSGSGSGAEAAGGGGDGSGQQTLGSDAAFSTYSKGAEGAKGDDGDIDRFYRSSYTTWLPRDDMLTEVQGRIAAAMGVPAAHLARRAEELQVVHYREAGGQFRVHHDSSAFHHRRVTALLYLNSPSTAHDGSAEVGAEGQAEAAGTGVGGETWFPFAATDAGGDGRRAALALPDVSGLGSAAALNAVISAGLSAHKAALAGDPDHAELLRRLPGVKVTPRRGDAVLFFNHLPTRLLQGQEGQSQSQGRGQEQGQGQGQYLDVSAVHAGLPVTVTEGRSGEKWVANYWF